MAQENNIEGKQTGEINEADSSSCQLNNYPGVYDIDQYNNFAQEYQVQNVIQCMDVQKGLEPEELPGWIKAYRNNLQERKMKALRDDFFDINKVEKKQTKKTQCSCNIF